MPSGPLLFALLVAARPTPPQDSAEKLVRIEGSGVTLEYEELPPEEAEEILFNITEAKVAFESVLGVLLRFEPTVRVRIRPGTQRTYYTDGDQRVYLNYSGPGELLPVQKYDKRVLDNTIACYAQLYLMRTLTSTAGLDHRILDSFSDYVRYLSKFLVGSGDRPPPPTGPGKVWHQLDELYGSGNTSFIFNTLAARKLPAHELGTAIREIAESATGDAQVQLLLDSVCSRIPYLGRMDLLPGEPLGPDTSIRPSRGSLFNGSRLMDQIGEEISVPARVNDFENVYSNTLRTFPNRSVGIRPPTVNGVQLWDVYFEFRARVLRAADGLDYYLVLREYFSRFQDQTLAVLSMHGAAMWKGVTGMSLESNGDRVFVSSVTPDAAPEKAGVKRGMEILEIDGRSTQLTWKTLQEYFDRHASCGSRVESRARALNLLLTGDPDRPAHIKLSDGTEETVLELERGSPVPSMATPKVVDASLREDGVGVIKIHSFIGRTCPKQFSDALDDLVQKQGAKAVVVDLRSNEGGDPNNAFMCLSRLVAKNVSIASLFKRDPTQREGVVDSRPLVVGPTPPPGPRPYTGPTAILVDGWTRGPSELFALGIQRSNRGEIIGQPTPGLVDQPISPLAPWQTLPATGVVVSFTMHAITNPDGTQLQGVGVRPDLPRESSPEEISLGVDGVLEFAAAHLLQSN